MYEFGLQAGVKSVAPRLFKHQLQKFHSHFAGYNQHDSQVSPLPPVFANGLCDGAFDLRQLMLIVQQEQSSPRP
jgi:hypothetical protein